MIDDILQFNKRFVAGKGYEPYVTDKYLSKKLAILTCMDTRLTVLLQEALGLKNGDAKIIKNAGGIIPSETDSAIRSILVAIYELFANEQLVDEKGNIITFNSMVDAMNYMSKLGWEFEQAYIVTVGSDSSSSTFYHWIISKVVDENGDPNQPKTFQMVKDAAKAENVN